MGPQLEALLRAKPLVRLRKIDVGEWDSEVSRQFEIRRLPTLILYDGVRLVSKDTQEVIDFLNGL